MACWSFFGLESRMVFPPDNKCNSLTYSMLHINYPRISTINGKNKANSVEPGKTRERSSLPVISVSEPNRAACDRPDPIA